MPVDRLRRHAQVERDDHDARADRAEVRRRQLRRRRRPGEEAVARLEPERAQPERGRARVPLQLAVRPALGRAVLVPDRERRPVAESRHRVVEQVEQRLDRARLHPGVLLKPVPAHL